MKKLWYLIPILGILFMSSCSKEASSNNSNTPAGRDLDSRLIGNWEYVESVGIGNNLIVLLNFNSNGTGSRIVKDLKLVGRIETIKEVIEFKWSTISIKNEIYFIVNGTDQDVVTYSFFIPNNHLKFSNMNTLDPNFVKQ